MSSLNRSFMINNFNTKTTVRNLTNIRFILFYKFRLNNILHYHFKIFSIK